MGVPLYSEAEKIKLYTKLKHDEKMHARDAKNKVIKDIHLFKKEKMPLLKSLIAS